MHSEGDTTVGLRRRTASDGNSHSSAGFLEAAIGFSASLGASTLATAFRPARSRPSFGGLFRPSFSLERDMSSNAMLMATSRTPQRTSGLYGFGRVPAFARFSARKVHVHGDTSNDLPNFLPSIDLDYLPSNAPPSQNFTALKPDVVDLRTLMRQYLLIVQRNLGHTVESDQLLKKIWNVYSKTPSTGKKLLQELTRVEVDCIFTAARETSSSPLVRVLNTETVIKDLTANLDDKVFLQRLSVEALLRAYRDMPDSYKIGADLVRTEVKNGLTLDNIIYNLLLDLFCRQHGPTKGEEWVLRHEIRRLNTTESGIGPKKGFLRDIHTCNIILRSYVVRKDLDRAIKFLDRIKLHGVTPNAQTWSLLSNGYVQRKDIRSARKCYDAMISHGHRPSRSVFECLIYGYLNFNIFKRPVVGLEEPTGTPHKVLDARQDYGLQEASKIFSEMLDHGFEPGVALYHMLMQAHYRVGRHDLVEKMFDAMEESGASPDLFCYSVYLQSILALGSLKKAEDVLQKMNSNQIEKDVVLYTILIDGIGKLGELEQTNLIYKEMVEAGIKPTEVTLCALLHSHCINGDMEGAKNIFDHFPQLGFKMNLVCFNIMIKGYGRTGDLDAAKAVFEEMLRFAVIPAVTTYNTLIAAHVRARDYDGAMQWYERLLNSGIEPSLVTFNILINANARRYNMIGALDAYNELIRKGLKPDDATFSSLMSGYARRGEVENALKVAEVAKQSIRSGTAHILGSKSVGIIPHNPMMPHNILIKSYSRTGKLMAIVEEYESATGQDAEITSEDFEPAVPDVRTFDILVRAFGRHGDVANAKRWFNEALRFGVMPDTRLYNALMAAFVKVGDAASAIAVQKHMEREGVETDTFTFTLLLQAHSSPNGKERQRGLVGGDPEAIDKGRENIVVPSGSNVKLPWEEEGGAIVKLKERARKAKIEMEDRHPKDSTELFAYPMKWRKMRRPTASSSDKLGSLNE
ncbi:hypothetical protein HDU97_007771 [Phlyctochytrium planicorne]|nr:hypothetical protein HDU97_007771 [Phlyctochytrium planicorne]